MAENQSISKKVYDTWMLQINDAERNLPNSIIAGEIWAEKVIKNGGEVYAGGDFPFWREAVHRAGGISFMRKLTPDVVLDKNDVVLLGFEYSEPENRKEIINPILETGATILLYAELNADRDYRKKLLHPNQLILIPSNPNLDGIIQLSEDSVSSISLTGMVNVFNLWVTTSEFIGACTRLGQMPNILVSIFHPKGWSNNGGYFYGRFYQSGKINPVEKGKLGKDCIEKVRKISQQIYTGKNKENIQLAVNWIKDAKLNNRNIKETVAGHWAANLPTNKYTPEYFQSKNKLESNDLRISLDYNFYPEEDIDKLLAQGIKVIFMTTSNKDENKFNNTPTTLSGKTLVTWENIPQNENLILIDGYWPQFDSGLTLEDYPNPFCPFSWVSHGLVHWLLIADSLEKIVKK